MDNAGEQGFGLTQTCHHNRFPEGLRNYIHHEVVNALDDWPKAMQFEASIVAVKQVSAIETKKAYTKTLV